MDRKGITPIVAVIVLLLITIALVGMAWAFLNNYIRNIITKTFIIPTNGAFCTGGKISIFVTNTAYQHTLVDEDFDVHLHIPPNEDSREIPLENLKDIELEENEEGLLVDYDCGSECGEGYHTVILGIGGNVQEVSIPC